MAQVDHEKTNTFMHYLLSHRQLHLQKIHPSAFGTVGLVLESITRTSGGNITWNSKGTFIQMDPAVDKLYSLGQRPEQGT